METTLFTMVWALLCYLTALIGKSREMGYAWSLVVCLGCSPLVGLIVLLNTSKKIDYENRMAQDKRFWTKTVDSIKNLEMWCIILLCTCGILFFLITILTITGLTEDALSILGIFCSISGSLGVYLLALRAKRQNDLIIMHNMQTEK